MPVNRFFGFDWEFCCWYGYQFGRPTGVYYALPSRGFHFMGTQGGFATTPGCVTIFGTIKGINGIPWE